MRREHTLKPLKASSYPRQCIWVDTETRPEVIDDTSERHLLVFGWACYRRELSPGKWSRPQWLRFTEPAPFWKWVESKTRERTALYWYAHNAAYDATVLQTWESLPLLGWTLSAAVIDAPPFLAYWRKGKRSLRMLDTLNLWQIPLKQIGEKVGLEKHDRPETWEGSESEDTYCKRDVEIIMEACIRWWAWLREYQLGGSAATMASQALVTFRHRFLKHTVFIDSNLSALQLARDAYHGGRTESFRIGRFTGPFYLLDVRSEYPTVMEQEHFPTILKGVYGGLSCGELREVLQRFSVVADVEIETDQPVYPYKQSSPLLFPVGRFRTVLTSGELSHVLRHHTVHRVYQCALYDHAPIFTTFVREIAALREKAIERGDAFEVWVLKRLMNALYGKFGQRGRRTKQIGTTEDLTARMWDEIDGETGQRYKIRQLAGIIEETWPEGESANSHPAIAAHVTGYGRLYLWGLIERAGPEEVLYCDTDSVLTTDLGRERLAPLCEGDGLGTLHLDRTVQEVILHSPKDYELDGKKRIKGVRANATWLDHSTVEQEKWLGMRSLLRMGDVSSPIVQRQVKHLRRRYDKGVVLPGGLTRPFNLPAEAGEWLTDCPRSE